MLNTDIELAYDIDVDGNTGTSCRINDNEIDGEGTNRGSRGRGSRGGRGNWGGRGGRGGRGGGFRGRGGRGRGFGGIVNQGT